MYFYHMILVTGGTGLVGGHLLYRFCESGTPTRAIYRDLKSIDKTRAIFNSYGANKDQLVDEIEWVQGDILEIPSLEEAMDGITQVYHCAAIVDGAPFWQMKKANVTGTSNIINTAQAHQIEKLCYVSSIATLGEPVGQRAINEEDFFNLDAKNSNYAISKYGGEMEVWRATQEGMNVIIVNPGVIIGEGNWESGSGKLFSQTYRKQPFYTDGSSGFVDVRDVTNAMIQLMNSDIVNERFIIVQSSIHYKEILSKISHSLKKKAPKIMIPKWMLFLISATMKVGHWIGFNRGLERATVQSLTSHSKYDGLKIKEYVDFNYTPIDKSIQRVGFNYLDSLG
ncbi:dihydroflavonol-4-reductase [Nonlabens ulvanivorans]|uniref:Dihydroflavonol-4-reductase n=1 Tax=Nonlabens ulvanivorans TaxID=906888 RepID=A0A090WBI6_NONUL|nr:NAD-dependent epimerase/dehydratase family protein [Nonlabens ulvanivorans]GAL73538.1 dihydroflavonol-4-reductase [Nonlabens ulvanivorans]